jgi:glycosyltransferase involved in cell wall biosynthesis
MNKIRVVHHSKTIGYSGTDKTAQYFCKYLKSSDKYEPYILYREGDEANCRIEYMKNILGEEYVIPYTWIPKSSYFDVGCFDHKTPIGMNLSIMPKHTNLDKVLEKINPDIFHVHHSGYAEFPAFKFLAPKAKIIETNIFGYNNSCVPNQIDLSIYVSEHVKNLARKNGSGEKGIVLYNPTEQPKSYMTTENINLARSELRKKYNLPEDGIVLGRVGRADNFDPISLLAFAKLEKKFNNVHYLVVNPCESWRKTVKNLEIKNVTFIDKIIDDFELSKFYLGLDIYAHARHDGECCPCNIQEAMMHGLPVVSHQSLIYNGQAEIISEAGFVVAIGDHESYYKALCELVKDGPCLDDKGNRTTMRKYFGKEARRRAMRHFEAETVTTKLIDIYDWVVSK